VREILKTTLRLCLVMLFRTIRNVETLAILFVGVVSTACML
jgi:hypothetical protein